MQEFLTSTAGQIIVQIIGFIAMGLGMLTFQAKTRAGFLALQTASVIFWGTQFLLLGSPVGAVLNIISLARNILYGMRGKYAALSTWWTPVGIIAAVAAVTAFSIPTESYRAIILGVGMSLQAIAYFCNSPKIIRRLSLIISPVCLVYNALCLSIAGIVGELLNLASTLIAMLRFRVRQPAAASAEAALEASADTSTGTGVQ